MPDNVKSASKTDVWDPRLTFRRTQFAEVWRPLAQLKSADAARWVGSRKTLVVWTAGIQTLLTFLGQARGNNFVRFTLSLAAVNFVVNLAAPYLAVYLLGELRYGYLTYTAVILAGSMVGMLAVPWWGRFGDRFGNQMIIRWTILGESVLPLFWAIFQEPAVIMLLQMATRGSPR